MTTTVLSPQGVEHYAIKAVIEGIKECGRNRMIIRSDNEPAVKKHWYMLSRYNEIQKPSRKRVPISPQHLLA